MKTVVKDGDIKRVEDSEATVMVTKGWAYCKKELWKAIRDKDKKPNTKKVEYKKVERKEERPVEVVKNDSSTEIMAEDHRVDNDGLAKYKAKKAKKKSGA